MGLVDKASKLLESFLDNATRDIVEKRNSARFSIEEGREDIYLLDQSGQKCSVCDISYRGIKLSLPESRQNLLYMKSKSYPFTLVIDQEKLALELKVIQSERLLVRGEIVKSPDSTTEILTNFFIQEIIDHSQVMQERQTANFLWLCGPNKSDFIVLSDDEDNIIYFGFIFLNHYVEWTKGELETGLIRSTYFQLDNPVATRIHNDQKVPSSRPDQYLIQKAVVMANKLPGLQKNYRDQIIKLLK